MSVTVSVATVRLGVAAPVNVSVATFLAVQRSEAVPSYAVTFAATVQAASPADAERAATEMAASVGATVQAVRDVSAPKPGERRCDRCDGPYDQPPADRAIPVCTGCLRGMSAR